MNKKYARFIVRLWLLTAAMAAFIAGVNVLTTPPLFPPVLYLFLLLFFIVHSAVHYVLLKITSLNPRKFVSYFMLSTTLKLFLYLIVLIFYVINTQQTVMVPVIAFFIMYIIFTVFEVISIINQTREDRSS
ncbi:MAG: hypothetical protein RBS55_09455 [Bacteroidales bacterium]|jgi:hypothetical protein|nr:hypothetical protein [Bacteroidales bacterium]